MKKLKIVAALAAIAVAIGIYFFLNYLSKPEEVSTSTVLVAAVNIPEKTIVTVDMLLYKELPQEAILKNALTNPETVIGKMVNSDMFVGEQMVSSRVVDVGNQQEATTLGYAVEPGMRAITIAVDNVSGVGFLLLPGDKVDIVTMYERDKINANDDKNRMQAKILVQNVTVLAVDSNMSRSKNKILKDAESGENASGYTSLTIMVTPTDATMLTWAESEGEVRAILRSPIDEDLVGTPSVTVDTIQNN